MKDFMFQLLGMSAISFGVLRLAYYQATSLQMLVPSILLGLLVLGCIKFYKFAVR